MAQEINKRLNSAGRNDYQSRGNTANNKQTTIEHVLSKDYLKDGLVDSDGTIRLEYLNKFAKEIGKNLTEEITCKKLGYNRVRETYEYVLGVNTDLENGFINYQEAIIQLEKLVGRVHKRVSMKTATNYFKEFISKNVAVISKLENEKKIRQAIKAFATHYEMVVCYTEGK